MENKPQETGTVKWYNDAKGYGFIISDSDSANVYAEKWNISNDPKTMFELQRVEFDRVQTDNGLKAINIKVQGDINLINSTIDNFSTSKFQPNDILFHKVIDTKCNNVLGYKNSDASNNFNYVLSNNNSGQINFFHYQY